MASIDELYEAEVELLLTKVGEVAMKQAAVASMQEGAWTGSHGGHDPDFNKLKGGLKNWWIKTVAQQPHPFTYCVRHLAKHVANPERLCAWLKDQVLNTTKWRKGSKKMTEADFWQPSIEELQGAVAAFTEAGDELDEELARGGQAGASTDAGGASGDVEQDGGNAGPEGSEARGTGTEGATGTPAVPSVDHSIASTEQSQTIGGSKQLSAED